MAVAELPPSFEQLALNGIQRKAAFRFLELAEEQAPEVTIVGPRRTQAGYLKLVLEFPEGDTWDLTQALSRISNQVRNELGVFFILD